MALEDILVDPISRKSLKLDWKDETIHNLSTDKFSSYIKEGIPVILPISLDPQLSTTDQHQKQNSSSFLAHEGVFLSKKGQHILVKINSRTLLSIKASQIQELLDKAKKETKKSA